MKHIIYKLVQPSSLRETDYKDYHMHTIERSVLEKLDVPRVEEEHDSFQEAYDEIKEHRMKLTSLTLVILPVISISYDGEIRGENYSGSTLD